MDYACVSSYALTCTYIHLYIMFNSPFSCVSQNHYKDAYKEWRHEKASSPDDLEFISILKESLDDANAKKEEAVYSLHEIEQSISAALKNVSSLETELDALKKSLYIVNDESSNNDNASDNCVPRSAKRQKRKVLTQQEIDDEIAEVFIDNDTSAAVTNNDVTASMNLQFE